MRPIFKLDPFFEASKIDFRYFTRQQIQMFNMTDQFKGVGNEVNQIYANFGITEYIIIFKDHAYKPKFRFQVKEESKEIS